MLWPRSCVCAWGGCNTHQHASEQVINHALIAALQVSKLQQQGPRVAPSVPIVASYDITQIDGQQTHSTTADRRTSAEDAHPAAEDG